MSHTYYDFFAGGGMAGVGLGSEWQCLFANDIDAKKAASYRANHHGGKELLLKDVSEVVSGEIPGTADLVWASFPCQDLSLAGKGAGLAGKRSGMFKPFWQLVRDLNAEGRGPKMVAVENVYGAITSNGGRDFATLAASFSGLGYRFGAVVVDAVHFLPQSRPRFFIIGMRGDLCIPDACTQDAASSVWHPPALIEGYSLLCATSKARWVWWNLPVPQARETSLSGLIEADPKGVKWHTKAETKYLLDMMTDLNRKKVEAAKQLGTKVVGTIYRRTGHLSAEGPGRTARETGWCRPSASAQSPCSRRVHRHRVANRRRASAPVRPRDCGRCARSRKKHDVHLGRTH